MSDTVEFVDFYGERFAVPARYNWRRHTVLMRRMADVDENSAEAQGLIASLVELCLRKDDLARFDEVCDEHCPDIEEQMKFVQQALEVIAARPTGQPSDSSAGLPTTSVSSAVGSSSQVIDRLVERGRPDLALIVDQADRSRASA